MPPSRNSHQATKSLLTLTLILKTEDHANDVVMRPCRNPCPHVQYSDPTLRSLTLYL